MTASLLALLLVLGAGGAHAQDADECYPLSAAECVEVQGKKFNNDGKAGGPAPAVAPTNLDNTHPVTGFEVDTLLLVALAAAIAGAGLFTASKRVEQRQTVSSR